MSERPYLRRHRVGAAAGPAESVWAAGALILAAALLAPGAGAAQKHLSDVPLANKIIPTGPTHQAFSGKVDSLDSKLHVLNVNSAKGDSVEIFPLKKNTKVETAGGRALALTALVPGTEVIVYYEQKGDRRSVQSIVVLPAKQKSQKTPPPS